MRVLRAVFIALLMAFVGCLLAFFVGAYLTRVAHMSDMEGGRGMFIVFVCAPLGILVGLVVVSTAEYNPCGWRVWLNNTTITLGMQNVLDADPPFVAGNFENGYDESLATIKGRFWEGGVKQGFYFSPFDR